MSQTIVSSKTILSSDWEPIAGYRLRRYLGRGGFGEVWEAEAPGGLAKAVKIAPVETSLETGGCRELEGLQKIRSVRHPYLLSIERFEIIDGYLVIVMELADRSLADRFHECASSGEVGIPRLELLAYLREAAEVLDLLNERHGLQHLDIKPENLFLSGGHVKVADFGLVQPRNTSVNRSMIAISPPYAPPELFDGRIEPTADQYSLAVTYQELLTGTRPYNGADVRSLILQHLKGRPDLSALPPNDRAVISKSLQRDPQARYPSCTALVQALENARLADIAAGTPGPIHQGNPKSASRPASRGRAEPRDSQSIDRIPSGPRATDSTGSIPQEISPPRPHYVRARLVRETQRVGSDTVAFTDDGDLAGRQTDTGDAARQDKVKSSFVAFLPIEIYAHKLRGFIDAMSADIVRCTSDQTILYLGTHGWFGRPTGRGMFLAIETFAKNPHSGYRIVDVAVWCSGRKLSVSDLGRRGILLIRCLKYHLMATDVNDGAFHSDAEVRALVLA